MENNRAQRCRACLIRGEDMYHLQEKFRSNDEHVHNLLELLQTCASVQGSFEDTFPQFICKLCVKKANDSYRFRLQCNDAQMQLQSELEVKLCSSPQLQLRLQSELEVKLRSGSTEEEEDEEDNTIRNNFPVVLNELSAKSESTESAKASLKIENKLKTDLWMNGVLKKGPIGLVPQKQRTCDQCGKEFKYRASMIKHKRKHNNVTLRSCAYCDESPATATLLARHMEQMHAHLKNIKCSECNKAFFKQANLRLHMYIHSGIKRHMCEVCGVSFALAGNLAAHRRLHTGLKPYTCNQCGRGFTQQAALRSHEAGHSDRKDHVCSECGAAFSRAGALRNHCKRHLPVRPFVCSVCNKAFTFSSERKRHMTIHTGEKNHECNICGSRFNRSTNLAVHRRIHTGETPHICSVCGKRFSQAHCLRTHMTTHTT